MPTANQELAIRCIRSTIRIRGTAKPSMNCWIPRWFCTNAGLTPRVRKRFTATLGRMHASFSDFVMTIHDAVGEGDTVCLRWSCKMRHQRTRVRSSRHWNPR